VKEEYGGLKGGERGKREGETNLNPSLQICLHPRNGHGIRERNNSVRHFHGINDVGHFHKRKVNVQRRFEGKPNFQAQFHF
jgi:hypothetical protein